MNKNVLAFGLVAVLGLPGHTLAGVTGNVVYILDGSNSMWGQVGGTPKIEVAKSVMADLVGSAVGKMNVALVAYGHRSEGACDDIEVLSDFGATDAAGLKGMIDGITPRGKTPISAALERASELFKDNDALNTVVLVSDGVETCQADPCAVAEKLAARGVNTRVHVVGLDIGAQDRDKLQCIADRGHGKYFDAGDANGLKAAMTAVTLEMDLAALAAEIPKPAAPVEPAAPPPPVVPEWVEIFRDDFDGTELGPHWTVANPDPDAFIVEEGHLVLISNKAGGLESPELPNRIALDPSLLPAGDWEMELVFDGDLGTARESIGMGLFNAPNDFLAASADFDENSACGIKARIVKGSAEKAVVAEQTAWNWHSCNANYKKFLEGIPRPIHIKLVKSGRSYHTAVRFEGYKTEEGVEWFITTPLNSLRQPKTPVLFGGQKPHYKGEAIKGESLYKLDSVVIRTLKVQ